MRENIEIIISWILVMLVAGWIIYQEIHDINIFEQLLMIFVDGLKFLYGKNDKVNINELTDDNFHKMNLYFESINYKNVSN